MTNVCVYDCAYCANRASNEVPRAAFKPRELADLTIAFYRRNYIEGLFLSSGVIRSPDCTTELMIQTLSLLREEHGFRGYIHAKAVPGTSPELVQQLGHLADRMSVNMELPSQRSLALARPREGQAADHRPHAADPRQHSRGQGHACARAARHHVHETGRAEEEGARIRAGRTVHADDRRRHSRKRLPDPQPLRGPLPHALAQARVSSAPTRP